MTDSLVPIPSLPLAETNPAKLYLSGLAASGRRTMKSQLLQIADLLFGQRTLDLDWITLRFETVQLVRTAKVERGLAPATVNASLYALRGVARAAWRLGRMTHEDYQRIRGVELVNGHRLPAGREVSQGELLALMEACARDDSPAGRRDAALIAIAYSCGLRRAEIAALSVEDFNPETGALRILGKGNRERLAYVVNGAADALADWLIVRGEESGPLFCPINKAGRIILEPMTSQALYNAFNKRSHEALIPPFTPHDLRRTFVSDLLDRGADIAIVQRLAGHAQITTTARYDRRPEAAKRKAAETLHVPYQRRNEE